MSASQVCVNCKSRKKKCDKRLPQCGFCEKYAPSYHPVGLWAAAESRQRLRVARKRLRCSYDYQSESSTHASAAQGDGFFSNRTSSSIQDASPYEERPGYMLARATPSQKEPYEPILAPLAVNVSLYLEVLRVIQATHRPVDDIVARYFDGIHRWVPFILPGRFKVGFDNFRSVPTAEFSLLLLCMCLLACEGSASPAPSPMGDETLYLNAKVLFTQIQSLRKPSIPLIQAGLLIAAYEYSRGKPDVALSSTDICARLAYAAGFDRKPERPGPSEEWNTWWGVRIFERIFYCDTKLTGVPLITTAPDGADPLPFGGPELADEMVLGIDRTVAPLAAGGIGSFGRVAQAAYLLDRVFQALRIPDIETRLSSLLTVDDDLQRFLAATMDKCRGTWGAHSGALGMCIRILFILHKHVLELEETTDVRSQWRQHSQAALDTATQMIIDITRSQRGDQQSDADSIVPICNYVVRNALQHLYNKRYSDSQAWFEDSDVLRESIKILNLRWPVERGLASKVV